MAELGSRWGSSWTADGLRMRFRPRNRLSQFFLQVVPWLDLVLVAGLFYWVTSRQTLMKGVTFELPRAHYYEAIDADAFLVMLRVDIPKTEEAHANAEGTADPAHPAATQAIVPTTFVFFDGGRYTLGDPVQLRSLRDRLEEVVHRGNREFLLLADQSIPHGEVLAIVNLARECGIPRISVSVRSE
ncbi:MAG: ExbD/TolR family protein [Kiritimatiellia bacterium]|jgi:biopolymer transport protein ExbD